MKYLSPDVIFKRYLLAIIIIIIFVVSSSADPITYKQTTDHLKRAYGSGMIVHTSLLYSDCEFNRALWRTKAIGCGFTYRRASDRWPIHFDHIAPSKRIADHVGCIESRAACARDHKRFAECYTDAHNLFPTMGVINLVKGARPVGNIIGAFFTPFGDVIDFRVSVGGGMVEPGGHAKGRVARAMLHMGKLDCVSLTDLEQTTFLKWHHQHPPTLDEYIRNEMIHIWQANRNSYISG